MSDFDAIKLAGQALRPAPYVSTTYEYNKFNGYIIGGFLIVTLSGTLVDEDINNKIANLNALQSNQDCVSLTIGCNVTGGEDFLNGAGRIRSVDINQGDQPFVANYTIVVSIETINGQPAVIPDPNFASYLGLNSGQIPNFVQSYDENIGVDGNAEIISSTDNGMNISKNYVKASGTINIKVYTNYICGFPNNSMQSIETFLQTRATAMMNGYGIVNPIALYLGWNKWLDTKSLEIKVDGSVTWSFDVYMTPSNGKPYAFIDATVSDKKDQRIQTLNRTISGSIKGLSSATLGDHIGHKADSNERIANAEAAFSFLDGYLKNGMWPGGYVDNYGVEGQDCASVCPNFVPPTYYQRISHNITKSVVSGEISFSMEFGDLNACKPEDAGIEVTVDEHFPAAIHQEIIIPNRPIRGGQLYPRSIIQIIAQSKRTVTITVRASLNSCDKSRLPTLADCARAKLAEIISIYYPNYANWRYLKETENTGSFSYTIIQERVRCDFII